MPTSTLVEGKGKGGNTWDIYIYSGGDGDDAWTMVHFQKNILPTFFFPFLRKITTMHYLPAW